MELSRVNDISLHSLSALDSRSCEMTVRNFYVFPAHNFMANHSTNSRTNLCIWWCVLANGQMEKSKRVCKFDSPFDVCTAATMQSA